MVTTPMAHDHSMHNHGMNNASAVATMAMILSNITTGSGNDISHMDPTKPPDTGHENHGIDHVGHGTDHSGHSGHDHDNHGDEHGSDHDTDGATNHEGHGTGHGTGHGVNSTGHAGHGMDHTGNDDAMHGGDHDQNATKDNGQGMDHGTHGGDHGAHDQDATKSNGDATDHGDHKHHGDHGHDGHGADDHDKNHGDHDQKGTKHDGHGAGDHGDHGKHHDQSHGNDTAHEGHGTGHAGHGAGHASHEMAMYFHFNLPVYLLFFDLPVENQEQLAGACVAIAIISAIYEGLKASREYLLRKSLKGERKRLIKARNKGEDQRQSCARKMCHWWHLLFSVYQVVQTTLGMFLMLIYMTFHVWLCVAVSLGSGLGYFLFSWNKRSVNDFDEDHCG